MLDLVAKLFGTFFYLGYFPFASGTIASGASVALFLWLGADYRIYVFVLAALTVIGFWASGEVEKSVGKKDPSCVVIDEVVGGMIAFFMLPATPAVMWTAFFLFRAFDMFKIYPINKLEERGGGAGIMLDDIVAGVYTKIIMQIALCFVIVQ